MPKNQFTSDLMNLLCRLLRFSFVDNDKSIEARQISHNIGKPGKDDLNYLFFGVSDLFQNKVGFSFTF